ncbi:MAG TPA: hypothetical protein VMQ76_13755 [Terracidiphilus sp.]|jgi:hypothetical protein|nr:hypothetical protein [Terracidiphilus sp.]
MTEKREIWYRTGAAAKLLMTSPYKIRALVRAGLIESELRNGYRYISERELDRVKRQGLPPMPASAHVDHGDGPDDQRPQIGAPPVTRNRLGQELYAPASRRLARSKEELIRLDHALQAKRIKREIREIDMAAQEDRARAQEERERARQPEQVQAWKDGYLRGAFERVEAEYWPEVCAEIETLLKSVRPFTDVRAMVENIVQPVLKFELKSKFQQQLDLMRAFAGLPRPSRRR